jgi:lipoprotein-anchoring transpeptidase ErfK/SrfK
MWRVCLECAVLLSELALMIRCRLEVYTRAMMNNRILMLLATAAVFAAGSSAALAQGYSSQGYPAQSSQNVIRDPNYPPGGYPADYRDSRNAPDFDNLDDDSAPTGQRRSASSDRAPQPVYSDRAPQGPVMSPDDPRYGRPAGPPAVIYSDRPNGGQPRDYSERDSGRDDSFSRGMRPPEAVGGGQSAPYQQSNAPTGSIPQQGRPEGRPVQLSALPVEEQAEEGEFQLPPNLRRQEVAFATKEPAGTIVVDTPNTYLYYVLGNGRAMRYGVRVGRDGFTWTGVQKISRKAEWPDWHPPSEMIERQPYLPRFMAGGPGNPMGARAMYLGSTVFRIHGTNQPSTIGKFVSSGCIGMVNDDVSDLFERAKVGTRVVVLPGGSQSAKAASAQAQPAYNAMGPGAQQGAQPQPGPQQAYNVPGSQPTSVQPLPAPVNVR